MQEPYNEPRDKGVPGAVGVCSPDRPPRIEVRYVLPDRPTGGAAFAPGNHTTRYIREPIGVEIALQHHEKWDGTGYPRGLTGEQIPLEGRITAVADVFDALTNRRPYKEPLSIHDALLIMEENRGSHFDPRVLDAFLSRQNEVADIMRMYTDE